MNAGGSEGPVGGNWGGDDEPWYPERRPIQRGRRERIVALIVLAVILGGVLLGVVRSVQVGRGLKKPSRVRCFNDFGEVSCPVVDPPLPA